jgi:hypothetical protein
MAFLWEASMAAAPLGVLCEGKSTRSKASGFEEEGAVTVKAALRLDDGQVLSCGSFLRGQIGENGGSRATCFIKAMSWAEGPLSTELAFSVVLVVYDLPIPASLLQDR